MVSIVRNLIFTILLLFFTGCVPTQEDVKDVFQTNSANIIKLDYKRIQKLLVEFKEKLDKRNPDSFDKNNLEKIYKAIKNSQKDILLKHKDMVLENYKDYLQLAFSKDEIVNRNDYLVLGLYHLINYAYEVDKGHKVLALEYSVEKLQILYKNLQILRWKIKVDRDINNKYLFLTWQNNWQIEMEKKYKDRFYTKKDIENLEYIKNKKESIYSHSNFSFEVILTQMVDATANSIKALGEEPKDLSLSALKIFIFL